MDCPPDEALKVLLEEATHDTKSIEVISHLVGCLHCRDRITSWDRAVQLDKILDAAGNSGIVYENPSEGNPSDGSDAVTNVYGVTPIRQIGQYELLRSVGHGGGGEVFEARHTHLNRRVAVKLLSKKNCENEAVRQRFSQEMESIGRLNHPNIVHAYDAGEIGGTLYLAMEFVDGLNLETLAQRIGPMEIWDACEVIRQAAQGLQHVFESGLVHRDLKPSNLLISKSGVKIADLGLAMFNRAESTQQGSISAKNEADDRLTGEHTVLGTVDYMAPEQAEGSRAVDIRADLYSLGCTLFRLLVGRAPYALPENSSTMKKMVAHASDPIPDIQYFRPDVPDKLAAVIKRLLGKTRAERYSEPRELMDSLIPFCGVIDFPKLILSPPRPPRKVVAGGRSSTLRNSEIRQSEAPTPLAPYSKEQSGSPPQPPAPPPEPEPSSHFSINRRTIVVSACLILVLIGLGRQFLGLLKNDEIPVVSQIPQGSEKSVPEEKPELEPKKRTAFEDVWFQQFNRLPEALIWSPLSKTGSGGLLENSATFNIHSPDSLRLEELGELKDNEVNVELEMDFKPHSRTASFGFFFRFRPVVMDEQAEFQAIQIIWTGGDKQSREAIVARHIKAIGVRNKEIENSRSRFERIPVPLGQGSMRLAVKVAGDRLVGVSVGGSSCVKIIEEEANSQFTANDYRGRFGAFVEIGVVDLQNPKFSRK
ncbi:MAG: serine/threonine-protein kinase [Planctomycetota bacterium]